VTATRAAGHESFAGSTRPHEIDRVTEGVVGVRVGGILAPTAMEIFVIASLEGELLND
jgi:hypothetical protein